MKILLGIIAFIVMLISSSMYILGNHKEIVTNIALSSAILFVIMVVLIVISKFRMDKKY